METGAMETDRDLMVENKEVEMEDKKDKEEKKDNKKEERNDNIFKRVKERLSMRSKKKNNEVKCPEAKANNVREKDISEQKIAEQSNKQKSDITNANNLEKEETKTVEKEKKGNILERISV